MEKDQEQLKAKLSALQSELSDWFESIEIWRVREAPPDQTVCLWALNLRRNFEGLRRQVSDLAADAGITFEVPPTQLEKVEALIECLAAIEASRAANARATLEKQAHEILAQVEHLAHLGIADWTPLIDVKRQAKTLREALDDQRLDASLVTAVEGLAKGSHPITKLIGLVTGSDLQDDLWWTLLEDVSQSFGREIATAVVRGRLSISGPPDVRALQLRTEPIHSEQAKVETQQAVQPSVTTVESQTSGEKTAPREEVAVPSTIEVGDTAERTNYDVQRDGIQAEVLGAREGDEECREAYAYALGKESTAPPEDKVRSAGQYLPSETEILPRTQAESIPTAFDRSEVLIGNTSSSAEIAGAILSLATEEWQQLLPVLVWQLVGESHLGLAFDIAHQIEKNGAVEQRLAPSWTLRAALLGPNISEPSGSIANLLSQDLKNFSVNLFENVGDEGKDALRLLLAAATLRPAVVAPATGAPSVLRDIHLVNGLPRFYEFCQAVGNAASQLYVPLDPLSLRTVRNHAAWQDELDRLRQEKQEWWRQARTVTLVYAPASQVWHRWLERNGPVARILAAVDENSDSARVDEVRTLTAVLQDDVRFKRLIGSTRKEIKRGASIDIQGRALTQLRSHAAEACQFAQRWLELMSERPEAEAQYIETQAEQLRHKISQLEEVVRGELHQIERDDLSRPLRSAVACCRKSFESLVELFAPQRATHTAERSATHLLHAELLRVENIVMDQNWEPGVREFRRFLADVLVALKRYPDNWREALLRRAEKRDHEATRRIIEFLEAEGDDSAAELRRLREQRISECREALRREIDETRARVEQAVSFGLLRENDRDRFIGSVEGIELRIDEIERFFEVSAELESVRAKIDSDIAAEIERARSRLDNLRTDSRLDSTGCKRIEDALDRRDVLTATEYIHMAETGLPLPVAETDDDALRRFFPEAARELAEFLDNQRPEARGIIDEIKGQRGLPGVSMGRVTGAQAHDAVALLEAWFELKRLQRVNVERLRRILEGLGFSPETIQTMSTIRGGTELSLTQKPLSDRERCPVPVYGSLAQGRYRMICLWQRQAEEDLLNTVGETLHPPPTLVFYFGRLTERMRRDLAHLCRRRRRTFVVVDELLVLFLCGERRARLRTLFDCALPFTYLRPYVTTAGLVPPELFFGRERERREIINQMGSCFIYGGRQLGKTALLRDVERHFNNEVAGRKAVWFDLKSSGIGYDRPIDDLWSLLAVRLKEEGVVPDNARELIGVDRLLGHIAEWLAVDSQRGILLLLDEADRFLEQDAQRGASHEEFTRTTKLKGLMDRSERRFKVVFAGLHNVQRTTRVENNPLAHYGEAICIGPLLENEEWKEARRLIQEPLAAMGYRFESEDLVTRILSQTNYFPSLIQLYCNQLLRHLEAMSFDPSNTPPFKITARHVDDAYRSHQLRRDIRDRFTWTLDLDPRYRVIALCLALHRNEISEHHLGFSTDWIYRQAVLWWPEGFETHLSEESFRSLLDEMVGLGVLRTDAPGRYMLRSPNVTLLMGTDEEIERAITDPNKEPPPEYEPSTYRSGYRGDRQDIRRNPLTAQQESELRARRNGVSIICGCDAAGLGDLEDFLTADPASRNYFRTLDTATDVRGFGHALHDAIERRKDEGTTLLMVPAACPWTPQWVTHALEQIKRLTSRQSFVHIMFLANSEDVWRLLSDGYDLLCPQDEVTVQTLEPWADVAVRHWLDDCGIAGGKKEEREEIGRVTGNWPSLLYDLYRKAQSGGRHWNAMLTVMKEEMARPQQAAALLDKFGVTQVKIRKTLDLVRQLPEAVDDIKECAELASVAESDFERAVRWAKILGLVRPEVNGGLRLDRVINSLLAACATDES